LVCRMSDQITTTDPALPLVVRFLNQIGIDASIESGACGFLEKVRIANGGLKIDPQCSASNVLHEAGHLAVLPAKIRASANGDLDGLEDLLAGDITSANDPDALEVRAAINCSDPEATAWAWAAGVHLGLSPDAIIRDEEYGGDGASIRLALEHRMYAGIHGLSHGGLCVVRPGPLEQIRGLPAYPKLARWLQE